MVTRALWPVGGPFAWRTVENEVGPAGGTGGPDVQEQVVGYSTMNAVSMPKAPSSRSTWLRMWQCQTHTPFSSVFMMTV